MLALLRTCKQIHAEATPIVYTQPFSFPGTQVVADFLLRIGSNRRLIRSLQSSTYATQSARTMFHLLSEVSHKSSSGLRSLTFVYRLAISSAYPSHTSAVPRTPRPRSRTSGTTLGIG